MSWLISMLLAAGGVEPMAVEPAAGPAATEPAVEVVQPLFARAQAPRLTLIKTIPVGYWAKSVELSPDGSLAVVASIKARNATVINTATLEVERTIEPGWFAPVEVAFLSAPDRVLISGGFMQHEIKISDMQTWEQVGRLRGGRHGDVERHTVFPKIITVSPDRSKIYVAYWRSENVGVFDAESYRRIGLVPVGSRPRGIAVTPDGRKAYVCNFGERKKSITVFRADRKPFRVLRTIRSLPNPRHIVITRDGSHAYVSLFGTHGGVARIDTATDTVEARSFGTSGGTSKTLKLSPDERWIFLVNYDPGTLSVFDTETLREMTRYPAGVYPQGVSVSADGSTLWTTEEDRVRVWKIEPPVVSARAEP